MTIVKNFFAVVLASALFTACNSSAHKTAEKQTDASHNMHNMISSSTGYADSINNGLIAKDTMKGSPQRTAMASVGKAHLHITYHSPGVKGRIIWGGLVPYNQVWATGAHTATNIQINHPIEIDSKKIDAGTYAIFTIPGEKEWTFILNKNYQQHLTDDYKETEDLLRLMVKPVENKLVQRLTYKVNKTGDGTGTISMEWEKIKIDIPFKTLQ